MSYSGNKLAAIYENTVTQTFPSPVGTTFTLDHPVASESNITLVINNVIQEPTVAYTVSGNTLTVSEALIATDDMWCLFNGLAVGTVIPPDNSVRTATIVDDAVTGPKVATDAIDGTKIALASEAAGDVMYSDGTNWVRLAKGTSLQSLRMNSGATAPEWQKGFIQGTEQSTTSGTSITFSSIPSGVSLIYINFVGVSLDASENILIQLGDEDGIDTTGYISTGCRIATATPSHSSSTSGFVVRAVDIADIVSGKMILALEDSTNNHWISSHTMKATTTTTLYGAGDYALPKVLTQIKVLLSGAGNFDAGAINIMYQ